MFGQRWRFSDYRLDDVQEDCGLCFLRYMWWFEIEKPVAFLGFVVNVAKTLRFVEMGWVVGRAEEESKSPNAAIAGAIPF